MASDTPPSVALSNTPSPHYRARSMSPTKGPGGFVQSAMLKREDSISKRWSTQSNSALSRDNSIASLRTRPTSGRSREELPSLQQSRSHGSSLSRVTPSSPAIRNYHPTRATSRHALDHQEDQQAFPAHTQGVCDILPARHSPRALPEPPIRLGPLGSSTTHLFDDDSSQPRSLSLSGASTLGQFPSAALNYLPEDSSSKVPTRSDHRRWSPSKSSWLESALTKQPDATKSPPPVFSPQQPKWMVDRDKARASVEIGRSPSPHKEVEITGGLMKAPTIAPVSEPASRTTAPPSIRPKPAKSLPSWHPESSTATAQITSPSPCAPASSRSENNPSPTTRASVELPSKSISPRSPNPITSKRRTSPSSAKSSTSSRSPDSQSAKALSEHRGSREIVPKPSLLAKPVTLPIAVPSPLPFLAARAQLKSARTKNYVAPDVLKDNILRGKAGLAITDGPQKTAIRDELKESILHRKETMQHDRALGVRAGDTVRTIDKPEPRLPEGLVVKERLSSASKGPLALGDLLMGRTTTKSPPIEHPWLPVLQKPVGYKSQLSASDRELDRSPRAGVTVVFTEDETRPPSSRGSSHTIVEPEALEHTTKNRAKGPRRRPPTSAARGRVSSS